MKLPISITAGILFITILNCYSQNTRLWATYYGEVDPEAGYSVATDAAGNVYLTGYTDSQNGIASGGFQNAIGGGRDAFLVKFDATGTRLWASYYGGTALDEGRSVATDAAGNVYLAGDTRSPGGISSGGFQNIYGGSADAFLVKFNSAGALQWSTYYGGTGMDEGRNVVADAIGNVYLAGHTASASGISSGGFQNVYGGAQDAFCVKFDAGGNRLWATYYGETAWEWGENVATDASGNVYLAGYTESISGIASGGFQNIHAGGLSDAFLVKFDAVTGNRLWATYYGGAMIDYGFSTATDAAGNVFLAGRTESASGIASGGFQSAYGGGTYDTYLVKFNSAGNRLWATYYGGAGKEDDFGSIATDASGNVYLGAITYSATGIASGGFQNNLMGIEVPFVVKFDAGGTRLCASYYGRDHDENGGYIAVDGLGNVYLSGTTASWAGIASGGFQNTYGGNEDAYVVKFTSCFTTPALSATVFSTNILCFGQCNGIANANPANGTIPYTYLWSNSQTTQAATGLCSGSYTVTVTDSGGATTTATVTVTQPPAIILNATSTNNTNCITPNGTATVTATGGSGGYTYSWSNSATTTQISNLAAQAYTVIVTDAIGCTQTQTLSISGPASPSVTAASTSVSCPGRSDGSATATALGGVLPYTYVWSPTGGTNPLATGLNAGIYTVSVTDANGCSAIITTTVYASAGPTVNPGVDVTILDGSSTTLIASATPATSGYLWNTGGTTASINVTPSITTTYTIIVTDVNGCTAMNTVTVFVDQDCSQAGELYLPNAFSPNEDGENDFLQIYYGKVQCIKTITLTIYDRWGEEVCILTNIGQSWDGKYKGKTQSTAVFVYYLQAIMTTGETITKTGNVSLVK